MSAERKTHSSGTRSEKSGAAKKVGKKRFLRMTGIILVIALCVGLIQTGAFAMEWPEDKTVSQTQSGLPGEPEAADTPENVQEEVPGESGQEALHSGAEETPLEPVQESQEETTETLQAQPDGDQPAATALLEELSLGEVVITFQDQHGLVIDTKTIRQDEVVPRTDQIPAPPVGKTFLYWTLDDGIEAEFVFGTATASGDMTFVPVFSGTHYVHFEAEGSETAVDPAFVVEGEAALKPDEEPVRAGYKFLWWSLEKNGAAYDFATPVAAPMTLHAVWEAQPVDYSVVSWLEKPNIPVGTELAWPRDYTSYKVAESSALAGTTISDLPQIDSRTHGTPVLRGSARQTSRPKESALPRT